MTPILKTYVTLHEFLAQNQAVLEQREVMNHLLLGICMQMQQSPEVNRPNLRMATVHRAQAMVLAGVVTSQFLLLAPQSEDQEALQLLCQHVLDNAWSIPGVHGPSPAVSAFMAQWATLTGKSYQPAMNMRLYELNKVIQPRPVEGQLRLATIDDLTQLAEWIHTFEAEALGETTSHEEAQNTALSKIEGKSLYLWTVNGKAITMAGTTRATSHGISINLVYTPPEQRGRGYASACVAALSQSLLDQGFEFCTLFTDVHNPTANSIYQKIGYVPVADFQSYRFKPMA